MNGRKIVSNGLLVTFVVFFVVIPIIGVFGVTWGIHDLYFEYAPYVKRYLTVLGGICVGLFVVNLIVKKLRGEPEDWMRNLSTGRRHGGDPTKAMESDGEETRTSQEHE